jgi:hypothetical protein
MKKLIVIMTFFIIGCATQPKNLTSDYDGVYSGGNTMIGAIKMTIRNGKISGSLDVGLDISERYTGYVSNTEWHIRSIATNARGRIKLKVISFSHKTIIITPYYFNTPYNSIMITRIEN